MESSMNPEKFQMNVLSLLKIYQKPQQNWLRSIRTIRNGMKIRANFGENRL